MAGCAGKVCGGKMRGKLENCFGVTCGKFTRHEEVDTLPKALLVQVKRGHVIGDANANALCFNKALKIGSLGFVPPGGGFRYELCCAIFFDGVDGTTGHYTCLKQVVWGFGPGSAIGPVA